MNDFMGSAGSDSAHMGTTPVTKKQIALAANVLALAVKIEQDAEAVLETIRKTYDAEFAAWLEDHLDIAGALDLAEEDLKSAKIIKSTADKAIREIAPTYFADHPEARKDTPGLEYRLERKPNFHENFVDDAVRAGATFLLRPDEKSWPEMVDRWLGGSLMVENAYVVIISEDKLVSPEPEAKAD